MSLILFIPQLFQIFFVEPIIFLFCLEIEHENIKCMINIKIISPHG